MSSSSSTNGTITHSHDLHIIIPTTNPSRVPSASATTAPTPLVTPGHGHRLFALPRPGAGTVVPLDDGSDGHGHTGLFRVLDDGSDGHGHTGLFRVPNDGGSNGHGHTGLTHGAAPSPTNPRSSARVARRSSLFSSSEACMQEEHENASSTVLPLTTEAEEQSSGELDGSFEARSSGEARVETLHA